MNTNHRVYKNMMSKFKESFSSNAFSSKSYQTSLISKSKTFRLDINLINNRILTSAKPFLSSSLIPNNFKDVPIKVEVTSWRDRNLDYSGRKHESDESLSDKSIKIERNEEVSKIEFSQISFTDDFQRSSTDNSQRSFPEDSQRSFPEDSQRSFPEDSQRSSTDDSQRSSTDDSQRSFTGDSQRSFTGDSQRSFTGDSQRSFTGDSQRSFTGDSQRSFTEDTKFAVEAPVRHLLQAKHHNSSREVQTQVDQKSSKFKSLRCDVCMKYFSSARNVRRHSVLHSLERHPCETCCKVFRTKENLKRHCRAMHEVKVNSFKCFKCFKAYSRRYHLNFHLKKHPNHVIKCKSTMTTTS